MAGNVQNDATGHCETCTAANVTTHASVLCSGASNRQHTVQGCMRHHQTTFVMVLMLASRLGLAAEEGELELSCKVLGNAPLTTRERIRRDRELHRLGLNLVERIPKDVLVDLVQVGVSTSLP